jgi:N-acetylmuramic acid 6-phosphate etherase
MNTERLSPRYADIDLWAPADILDAMIEGQLAAVASVRAARGCIEEAALAMECRLRGNGRLIYAGAGTSGRLAVQDGVELIPTFSWPRERLLMLLAGGDGAMGAAVEGAEDEIERAGQLVRTHGVGASDVLIAVAASGTTPFTVACMREGRRSGALTIGIANNPGTPLLAEAEQPILLETGPEPIAGSTRMNAGTAQRITLNLLSSLVMIRLGRVYRGMMVDVQATNSKLANRQAQILSQLTGQGEDQVRTALMEAGGRVKVAALVLKGCSIDEAIVLLERCGGRLAAAFAELQSGGTPLDATRADHLISGTRAAKIAK